MNLQPGDNDEPDINLTPLIDVVFLLLIFFMVSTTFEHQSRIRIDLPEASAEPVSQEQESLEIIIDMQGRYFIGDQQVVNSKPATLRRAIRREIEDASMPTVVIRADAKTPHQAVITALDVASQLGLTHISLATSKVSQK